MNSFYKIVRFCVILSIFLSNHLYAVVKTSIASGNYNVATTWVGGIVPISTNDVVIALGHTVTLVTGITLQTVTIYLEVC
jgi:hypothetical protein